MDTKYSNQFRRVQGRSQDFIQRGGGGGKEKLGLRKEISGKREKTYVKELKGSKRGTLLSY